MSLLPDLATDAAAPALEKALARAQRQISRRRAALADGSDEDFGHGVRVAIRKARTLLALDDGSAGRRLSASLRAELGWFASLVGTVRDLHVTAQAIRAQACTGLAHTVLAVSPEAHAAQVNSPPHDGNAGLAEVLAVLEQRRRHGVLVLAAALESPRFHAMVGQLDQALALVRADHTGRPLRPFAARAARQRLKAVLRRIGRLGPDSPPEAVHELRKDGKKLRYALDASPGLLAFGWSQPLLRCLKELQAWLGHFQDLSVRIEVLEQMQELDTAPGRPHPTVLRLLAMSRAQRHAMAQGIGRVTAPLVALEAEIGLVHELKAARTL